MQALLLNFFDIPDKVSQIFPFHPIYYESIPQFYFAVTLSISLIYPIMLIFHFFLLLIMHIFHVHLMSKAIVFIIPMIGI